MDRKASLGSNMLNSKRPEKDPSRSKETAPEPRLEDLEESAPRAVSPTSSDPVAPVQAPVSSSDWQSLVVGGALVLVGVLAWLFYLREPPLVDVSSLGDLPMDVGAWNGQEIPMTDKVSQMLEADVNIQRAYLHEIGGFIWFYFGYYGTERGGEPVHTPPYCYKSQGWTILESNVVPLGSDTLFANELVVERAGEKRLVRFWYQSYNQSGMLSKTDRVLARMEGLLLDGRSDGSLVRVSTPLLDRAEVPQARARLNSFVREMAPHLTRQWPTEVPPLG
jgi:EpsI family protein